MWWHHQKWEGSKLLIRVLICVPGTAPARLTGHAQSHAGGGGQTIRAEMCVGIKQEHSWSSSHNPALECQATRSKTRLFCCSSFRFSLWGFDAALIQSLSEPIDFSLIDQFSCGQCFTLNSWLSLVHMNLAPFCPFIPQLSTFAISLALSRQ